MNQISVSYLHTVQPAFISYSCIVGLSKTKNGNPKRIFWTALKFVFLGRDALLMQDANISSSACIQQHLKRITIAITC